MFEHFTDDEMKELGRQLIAFQDSGKTVDTRLRTLVDEAEAKGMPNSLSFICGEIARECVKRFSREEPKAPYVYAKKTDEHFIAGRTYPIRFADDMGVHVLSDNDKSIVISFEDPDFRIVFP